jgi:hypothetical protein
MIHACTLGALLATDCTYFPQDTDQVRWSLHVARLILPVLVVMSVYLVSYVLYSFRNVQEPGSVASGHNQSQYWRSMLHLCYIRVDVYSANPCSVTPRTKQDSVSFPIICELYVIGDHAATKTGFGLRS